jgi:geranylgeranyl diphosphate synthase type I
VKSGAPGAGGPPPAPPDDNADEAAHCLALARRTVDPALRAATASLPAPLRTIAEYHLGFANADGSPAAAQAGKAIRPALVLAAARACGGDAHTAVPAATALELIHNFTLLHDDVMDGDHTRRHRLAAWKVYGTAAAILAGDALQALALRTLCADTHPAARHATRRLADCVIELCDGQHADCASETRREVALEECLRTAEAKTGALLGAACAIGALYADADAHATEAMNLFGRQVGLAFQLADDLMGIWGDPAVTGKPAGSDLAARRKTLPVVAALASGTGAGARLAALYRTGRPLGPHELRTAAQAVDEAGGRAWANARAAEHLAAAVGHLADAVPDPADAGELLALAELATRRDH